MKGRWEFVLVARCLWQPRPSAAAASAGTLHYLGRGRRMQLAVWHVLYEKFIRLAETRLAQNSLKYINIA